MLEIAATELFQWFQNNNLKANADKCHLLLSTSETKQMHINDANIDSCKMKILIGILIDNMYRIFVFRQVRNCTHFQEYCSFFKKI